MITIADPKTLELWTVPNNTHIVYRFLNRGDRERSHHEIRVIYKWVNMQRRSSIATDWNHVWVGWIQQRPRRLS